MPAEFDLFAGFFHQDAFLDGGGIEDVANLALDSMSHAQIEALVRYLDELSVHPSQDVVLRAWNRSRSDFAIRGGDARKFVRSLSDLARSRLGP